jgi:hypothetical protein
MYADYEGFISDHKGMVLIATLALIFGSKYIEPLFKSLLSKLTSVVKPLAPVKQEAAAILQTAIVSSITNGEVELAKKLMDLHLTNEVKP